jgi:hypothetical protein
MLELLQPDRVSGFVVGMEDTVGDPEPHAVPLWVGVEESEGDWEGERLGLEEPVPVGTCEVAAGEALQVTLTVAEPLADEEAHDETVTDTLPEPLGEGDSLSLCVDVEHSVAVTQAEDEGDDEAETLGDEVPVAY